MAISKKSDIKQTKFYKNTFLWFAICVLLLVFLVAYFINFKGFAYQIAKFRCGREPVFKYESFEPTQYYYAPDNPMYKFYKTDLGTTFYCTEEQAQKAGLYKN